MSASLLQSPTLVLRQSKSLPSCAPCTNTGGVSGITSARYLCPGDASVSGSEAVPLSASACDAEFPAPVTRAAQKFPSSPLVGYIAKMRITVSLRASIW
jgi:hypothetical protein